MNLQERQAEMKARMEGKKKLRQESCGTRWSKFGTSNSDTHSLMQSSIPRWGSKIKTRSAEKPQL